MAEHAAQTAVERDPLVRKALTHSLAFWATVVPVALVISNALNHQLAFDVHYVFVPAAHDVLHGASPYSGIHSWAVRQGIPYLYPPLGAYLFAPFTLLPTVAAGVLATALVAACVPATLLVLGVRDWRCHLIAFLWLPIIAGIQSANLTLPMMLGLALVWRYRDRKIVVALVTGLLVALKLFFWPLLLWLVATRRYRAAAIGAAASAVLVFAPWAGIGFAGLHLYPHLLSAVARREGAISYSVAALVHLFTPSWTAAVAVETVLGVALLALVLAVGRRGRERDAFALAILAILVFTPLLEMHYFALLLVVVALYRDRLSVAWVVPLLMWGAPESNNGSGLQRVHVLLVAAAVVALVFSDRRPRVLGRRLRFETTERLGSAFARPSS
jgi:glycosyl transferase family 87